MCDVYEISRVTRVVSRLPVLWCALLAANTEHRWRVGISLTAIHNLLYLFDCADLR
jgi:hypothetical protein